MKKYDDSNITIIQKPVLSLGTIGFITWIVFMIMDYGCHMDWIVNANNVIRVGGHFWTWFPLWAPFALSAAILILCLIIAFVAGLIAIALDK